MLATYSQIMLTETVDRIFLVGYTEVYGNKPSIYLGAGGNSGDQGQGQLVSGVDICKKPKQYLTGKHNEPWVEHFTLSVWRFLTWRKRDSVPENLGFSEGCVVS